MLWLGVAGKLIKRKRAGFTVAVLAGGVEVSKRRRKVSTSKLFPGAKRKPPARVRGRRLGRSEKRLLLHRSISSK